MIDYFSLVGIPRKYGIDVRELRRKYLQHSRETHPDYHTQAGEEEIRKKEEESAALNIAWNKLSDDRLRLEYLLLLEEIPQDDSSLPPSFLMEMMDLNERLEEDGRTEAVNEAIQSGRRSCWEAALLAARAYDEAQEVPAKREALQKASNQLLCLKYYDRLIEDFS